MHMVPEHRISMIGLTRKSSEVNDKSKEFADRRLTKRNVAPSIEEVSEESKSSASTHSVHSSRIELPSEDFQGNFIKHSKTLGEDELVSLLPVPRVKRDDITEPSCFESEQHVEKDTDDQKYN